MRLLLIEDEALLAKRLARGLREEGFAVDTAETAAVARRLVMENAYDLLLLDLKLPDAFGLDLLRRWRGEEVAVPVLILTALDEVGDKVTGLEAGADDYLTKPFAFEELLARVRALLRRRRAVPVESLEFLDLKLDRTRWRVERAGEAVNLTPKEISLLEFFLLHAGTVLSRTTISEHVWDGRYEARSNVIDVIVGRLRRKLEAGGHRRLIHSVVGIGYVLRADPGDPA